MLLHLHKLGVASVRFFIVHKFIPISLREKVVIFFVEINRSFKEDVGIGFVQAIFVFW